LKILYILDTVIQIVRFIILYTCCYHRTKAYNKFMKSMCSEYISTECYVDIVFEG